MKRLKNPKKVLFYNTLTAADVGVYDDAKQGSKAVLNFKKEGVSLLSTAAIDTTPSATSFTTGVKATASYTDDGIYQSCLLKLNAPAGAEDIYYDYSLSIRKLVKTPGVNTFHNNTYMKTYGGTLDAVETSGGYVTDAYKLIMENNLIDYITADVSMGSQNTDFKTNFAGAIVEARRAYLLDTIGFGGAEHIYLYDENGVLITGADVTIPASNIAAAVAAFNDDAQVNPHAIAVAASTTSMYILFKTAGYTGTVVVSGGTIAIDSRYIHLVSKDTEVQFNVEFETPNFFTRYNFGIMRWTFGHNHDMNLIVNGTADTITIGANAAALVAALIGGTAGTARYVYASKHGASPATALEVVCLPTCDSIAWSQGSVAKATGVVTAGFTTSTATNYLFSTPTGKFPSLTSDDVARAVMGLQHLGDYPFQYKAQPTDGSAYAKYTLKVNATVNSDFGVSELATFEQEVDIYVLKSQAVAITFDNNDLYAHTTPDCNFECLLSEWHGVNEKYWIPDVFVTD